MIIYKVLTINFVQIKYDVLDELSIVQICATNFTDAALLKVRILFVKNAEALLKTVIVNGTTRKINCYRVDCTQEGMYVHR